MARHRALTNPTANNSLYMSGQTNGATQSQRDRVFVSSSAIKARTVSGVVEECARRGLRHLELTSSFPHYARIRQEVAAAAREGMRLLLHNYFPPPQHGFVLNLASADPTILHRSIEHCRAGLELCAEIGAPFFSVHAGFSVDPKPSDLGHRLTPDGPRTKAEAAKAFHDTVALLCETAEHLGIAILIENNVLSRPSLVNGRNELLLGVTGDDFDDLFDAVPSRSLGMLLDVAHLKVSAQTLGIDRDRTIEHVRSYVRALHLSDNNGERDNNQPFNEDAWFLPHLKTFSGIVCVIETRPLDRSALAGCVRIVEEVR